MPNYDVGNRATYLPWNIAAGPPRPRAVIHMGSTGVAVDTGTMKNIAFTAEATGLFTNNLANGSAFAILWSREGSLFARASLIHIVGGLDPNAVSWPAMLADMGPGGSYYGVLASSQSTVLAADFVAAVQDHTHIPARNIWVYNADAPGGIISFGVDWNGFVGETLSPG